MVSRLISLLFFLTASVAYGQEPPNPKVDTKGKQPAKEKMEVLAVFDAGQPDASIFKLYDKTSGVICYLLAPDLALRRSGESGWSYESNSLGSLSCVKDVQAVIPVRPKEK